MNLNIQNFTKIGTYFAYPQYVLGMLLLTLVRVGKSMDQNNQYKGGVSGEKKNTVSLFDRVSLSIC